MSALDDAIERDANEERSATEPSALDLALKADADVQAGPSAMDVALAGDVQAKSALSALDAALASDQRAAAPPVPPVEGEPVAPLRHPDLFDENLAIELNKVLRPDEPWVPLPVDPTGSVRSVGRRAKKYMRMPVTRTNPVTGKPTQVDVQFKEASIYAHVLPFAGPLAYHLKKTGDFLEAAELTKRNYALAWDTVMSGDAPVNALNDVVQYAVTPMVIGNLGNQIVQQGAKRNEVIEGIARQAGLGELYADKEQRREHAGIRTMSPAAGAAGPEGAIMGPMFQSFQAIGRQASENSDPIGSATRPIEMPPVEPVGGWFKATRRISGESVAEYKARVERMREPRRAYIVDMSMLPESFQLDQPGAPEKLRRLTEIQAQVIDPLDEQQMSVLDMGGAMMHHTWNQLNRLVSNPIQTIGEHPVFAACDTALALDVLGISMRGAAYLGTLRDANRLKKGSKSAAKAMQVAEDKAASRAQGAKFIGEKTAFERTAIEGQPAGFLKTAGRGVEARYGARVPGISNKLAAASESPAGLAQLGEGFGKQFTIAVNPITFSKRLFNEVFDAVLESKSIGPGVKKRLREIRVPFLTDHETHMVNQGLESIPTAERVFTTRHQYDSNMIEVAVEKSVAPLVEFAEQLYGKGMTEAQKRAHVERGVRFLHDEMTKKEPRITLPAEYIENPQTLVDDLWEFWSNGIGDEVRVKGATEALIGFTKQEAGVMAEALFESFPEEIARQGRARVELATWIEDARMGDELAALKPYENPEVVKAAGFDDVGSEAVASILRKQTAAGNKYIEEGVILDANLQGMYKTLDSIRTPEKFTEALHIAAIAEREAGLQAGAEAIATKVFGAKGKAAKAPLNEQLFFDRVRAGARERMAFDPEGGFQLGPTLIADALMDEASPLHTAAKKAFEKAAFSLLPRESAIALTRAKYAKDPASLAKLDDYQRRLLDLDPTAVEAAAHVSAVHNVMNDGFEMLRTMLMENADAELSRGMLDGPVGVSRMTQYFKDMSIQHEMGIANVLRSGEFDPLYTGHTQKTLTGEAQAVGKQKDAVAAMVSAIRDTSQRINAHDYMQTVGRLAANERLAPSLAYNEATKEFSTVGKLLQPNETGTGARAYVTPGGQKLHEIVQGDLVGQKQFTVQTPDGPMRGNVGVIQDVEKGIDGWFYDADTGNTFVRISKDKKAWGPLSGQIVEQSAYQYVTRGDPQKIGGAIGLVYDTMMPMLRHVKSVLVAQNPKSIMRNFVSNAAIQAIAPGTTRSTRAADDFFTMYAKWLKGEHIGNDVSRLAEAGLMEGLFAKADLPTPATVKAHNVIQGLVYDALNTPTLSGKGAEALKKSANIGARAVGHAMKPISKGVESWTRLTTGAFNGFEIGGKGTTALGFLGAKRDFVSGLAELKALLGPKGMNDEAILNAAIHGQKATEYSAVVAAYADAKGISVVRAPVQINSILGKTPTKTGLPDYYRFWGSKGEKLTGEVLAAMKNEFSAAVDYANKILLDYSRINAATQVTKNVGALAGLTSPFMTWSVKMASVTGDILAANPIYALLLSNAASISNDYIVTHTLGLDPVEGREVLSLMAPSDKMYKIPQGVSTNPVTGERQVDVADVGAFNFASAFDNLQWRLGAKTEAEALPLVGKIPAIKALPTMFTPVAEGLFGALSREGVKNDLGEAMKTFAGMIAPPSLVSGAVGVTRALEGSPKRPGTAQYQTWEEAASGAFAPVTTESIPINQLRQTYKRALDKARGNIFRPMRNRAMADLRSGRRPGETQRAFEDRMSIRYYVDAFKEFMTGADVPSEAVEDINRLFMQVGEEPIEPPRLPLQPVRGGWGRARAQDR